MDAQTKPEATFKAPASAAVWFEIPVTDMEKAKAFYSTVLMTEFRDDNTGPNPMSVFAYSGGPTAVSGHLYPGRPAPAGAGPTIHLPLPDSVENAMERCNAAGGRVLSPIIEIPAGRFAYCLDPDGNSIGLFSN
jgi:predicted enzyme related to lactoylglutathione lyase